MPLITDYFSKASNGTVPVPTTLASQKASGAASLSLSLATGWPTTTPLHLLLYEVDANNKLVAGTETLWKGILAGTTVSGLTLRGGTDTTYPASSPVELAFTSAQLDDLITGIQVSHNPDGTMISSLPLTTPVLTSPSFNGNVSNWIGASESWTYASATTITVPSDATTKYDAGDYLQLTQSATVKYFVVTNVAATVLTVAGISGAVIANSAISSNSYSKTAPHGTSSFDAFALNMKSAVNSGTTIAEGSQNLAAQGLTISFTVAKNCNALVTVSLGISSASDFEFRPAIYLGGIIYAALNPAAASYQRAANRGFTYVVPLITGVNVISAGVFVANGGPYSMGAGGGTISALVLGQVTA